MSNAIKETQETNVTPYEPTQAYKDLEDTHRLCKLLLQTPHYSKMGEEGIYAIVQTAKSLGIDPRLALGGGLYFIKGRVEMTARMMSTLIRSKKHTILKDKKSDHTACFLHGKRADTGDEMSASFTIEEAQKAGLTNGMAWKNYPADMLFARALSRLGRQLFADVIGNCYVEGEIDTKKDLGEVSDISLVTETSNEDEEFEKCLPEKIDPEKVAKFINHISESTQKNTIFIKNSAIKNMERFVESYKKWEEKKKS